MRKQFVVCLISSLLITVSGFIQDENGNRWHPDDFQHNRIDGNGDDETKRLPIPQDTRTYPTHVSTRSNHMDFNQELNTTTKIDAHLNKKVHHSTLYMSVRQSRSRRQSANEESHIADTFQLLKEGDRFIEISEQKDMALLLGNTGAGKSTLTQFIAGDNDKLISVETSEGSNVYVIQDKKRISNSTLRSHTIFPELVVDMSTNTAFYDCPGFSDTRNTTMDIAATYFTKLLLSHAKSVKLIFVVNHSSVSRGIDRSDFTTLVMHILKLIKDVDKFKDCIALVVTKVDNVFDKRRGAYVTDQITIRTIATFISNAKMSFEEDVEEDRLTEERSSLYKKGIQLLDIFLEKEGDEYKRISIFRKPDESGPLSQIDLLKAGKSHIRKVIIENTRFVPANENDFGYTLSDKSRLGVSKFAQQINEDIATNSDIIARVIPEFYSLKSAESGDVEVILVELRKGYNTLSTFTETSSASVHPKTFLENLISCFNKLHVTIPNESLSSVTDLVRYFEFFESVNNEHLTTRPLKWLKPFNKQVKDINNMKIMYEFALQMYARLSEYDIQSDTSKYNVVNMFEWGMQGKTQGIRIDRLNFKIFIDKIKKLEIHGYDNMKDVIVSDLAIETFNKVLKITLYDNVSTTYIETGKLIIKGDYIKMSYVNRLTYAKGIKEIEIYALNTVFIDEDFIRVGEEVQVTIISPRWVVIGTRKLVLDGATGAEHSPSKANDGAAPGSSGQDGMPGLPGLNGGNFLGIGRVFVNGEELTISVNAAAGGKGQDGGNGAAGSQGIDHNKNTNNCEIHARKKNTHSFSPGCTKLEYLTRTHIQSYVFKGTDGGVGGAGGAGGIGGKGSFKGNLLMVGLDGVSGILVPETPETGILGDIGRGGKGKKGGQNGKISTYLYFKSQPNKFTELVGNFSSSGIDGLNGFNSKDAVEPEKPKEFNKQTIINFKSYLNFNLKNPFKVSLLTKFVEQLDINPEVTGLYDTQSLVQELFGLESQFHELNGDIDFRPLYQSLLTRITYYERNRKYNETSDQFTKVLSSIYAATLSKICSLEAASNGDLIIDINLFLDDAIMNIHKLNEKSKETQDIVIAIALNDTVRNYKNKFDSKIILAKHFIDKHIIPDMIALNRQIDQDIDMFISEIIINHRNYTNEIQELVNKQKTLEQSIKLFDVNQKDKLQQQKMELRNIEKEIALRAEAEREKLIRKQREANNRAITSSFLNAIRGIGSFLSIIPVVGPGISAGIVGMTQVSDSVLSLSQLNRNNGDIEAPPDMKLELKATEKRITLAVETVISYQIKNQNDQRKLDEINQIISEKGDQLNKISHNVDKIFNTMLPILKDMRDNYHNVVNSLGSQAQVALGVTKWKVQSALKDIQLEMKYLSKGLVKRENVSRLIEKLDEGITTLINVFDQIHGYNDQKMLADYVAAINSAGFKKTIVPDVALHKAVVDLEVIIQSNIVLGQYERAVSGFKQWVFPFAHYYLKEFTLPSSVKASKNITDLITFATKQLEGLKSKVMIKSSTIELHDEIMQTEYFNSDQDYTKPFYIWENKKYYEIISNILSGREVTLMANLMHDNLKNAVKFNLIEILFTSSDTSLQREINTILKNFKVRMVHLGNSYYRCGSYFYVLPNDIQAIEYSFGKHTNGERLNKNEVYDKMMKGNILLSPYAMWSIQLINMTKQVKFGKLNKFRNHVDLELVGRGQYVSNGEDICWSSKLDPFYNLAMNFS